MRSSLGFHKSPQVVPERRAQKSAGHDGSAATVAYGSGAENATSGANFQDFFRPFAPDPLWTGILSPAEGMHPPGVFVKSGLLFDCLSGSLRPLSRAYPRNASWCGPCCGGWRQRGLPPERSRLAVSATRIRPGESRRLCATRHLI